MLRKLQLQTKKILLSTALIAMGVSSWAQETIASQDFEVSPSSPTLSYTSTGAGSFSSGTNGSGRPQNADLFANGSRGWQVRNGNSILTFANQSLDGYNNTSVDLRVAGMSVNSTNGIDSSDNITVDISLDGGTTYSSEIEIVGSSANQRWDFTGSGNSTINYIGDDEPVIVTSSTNSPVSTITINLPSGATQVSIIVSMDNNSSNERWVIDDVRVRGTASGPTVATDEATNVASTSATLNGTVNADGNTLSTSFDYGTTDSYGSAIAAIPSSVTGSTDTAISAGVTDLTVNTEYHYRAVGTYNSETVNGGDETFWTLAVVPNAPTVDNATLSTLDVTIEPGANNAATTYAIQTGGLYVQNDSSLGASQVYQTFDEWGTVTVTGLTDDTSYTFTTIARNGEDVSTTSSNGTTGSTLANTDPFIETTALDAFGEVCIDSTSVENSFTITGENLTSENVVVGPLTSYSYSDTANGAYNATVSFTPDDSGNVNSTVFVRFSPTEEVSYDGNIIISGGGTTSNTFVAVTGSGANTPATVTTADASSVTDSTATLGGDVTDEGCTSVTSIGVVVGTSANPAIGDSGVSQFTVGSGGSGSFIVTATDLSSNTLYYARAYAVNDGATSYGDNVTFTTACGDFNLPFSEDFEAATFPPTCWTSFIGTNGLGTGANWQRITSNTYNGSAGTAYVEYEAVDGGNAEDWLVTPPIVLPDTNGTLELEYYESQSYGTDYNTQYYIRIATANPTDPESYIDVTNYGETDFSDSYSQRTVDLTAYEGQTVYIAFVKEQNDGDDWYIDDVSVSVVAPSLDAPVANGANSVATTSFVANWDAVSGANGYRLDISTSENFGTGEEGQTTTETFDNIPASSSNYSTRTWTGTDGVTWEANPARTDQTLNGKAITLNEISTAYLESGEISGGISSLSFNVIRAFGGGTGTLTVKILTGASFDTETEIGTIDYNDTQSSFSNSSITGITSTFRIRIESDGTNRAIIDDLSFTTAGSFTASYVSGYENLSVGDVTSYTVTGLTSGTTYYYKVRAENSSFGTTSDDSNSITVETGISNVWNGTQWTAGSPPTIIDEAVIEGDYNTGEDGIFTASILTLNTGGTMVISSGDNLTINTSVVNNESVGSFIIENNANLIQIEDSNTNSGGIRVIKSSSPLYRLDYTIWSSPVSGQNLFTFSPETLTNRFYDYDESTDLYSAIDPALNDFEPGYGYLIRMPNNHVSFVDNETPGVEYVGSFEGVPNNGTVTVPMETSLNGYNLVGNPYPSPINISDFFTTNSSTLEAGSALYFWRKRNNPGTTTYATVTNGAYTANSAAGGDTGSGTFTGDSSTWVINPGQGFFVQATGETLEFNNTMRRSVNNSQFFRNAQDVTQESSRIWLNLFSGDKFSQTAVVYNPNMTLGIDYGWDGRAFIADGAVTLYSVTAEESLAIQARPEFDTTDEVTIGFYAESSGTYTISLDHVDGLFINDQSIYLVDNITMQYVDLTQSDYEFNTEAGTFDDRFLVVYEQPLLSTETPVLDSDNVIVFQNNGDITIDAGALDITSVSIYDTRGRMLYNDNNVNATQTNISNLQSSQQVLIVNITTSRGTVSKKVIH